MATDWIFRSCTAADADQLIEMGRETYRDTFAGMTSDDVMAAYLDSAFERRKILGELSDPDSLFLFLLVGGELAGYLKVNEGPAQTDLREDAGLEIERIYLRRAVPGTRSGEGSPRQGPRDCPAEGKGIRLAGRVGAKRERDRLLRADGLPPRGHA